MQFNAPDLNNPEVADLDARTRSLAIDVRTLQITTPEAYTFAADKLQAVKGCRKRLDEIRRGITKPLDDAKEAVMAFFRVPADRLDSAEKELKASMLAFQQAEQRRVQEEQARLEEAARKERERLQRQAEAAAAKGREERAAELAVRAATVVAPVAQTAVPQGTGAQVRETWTFEVVNAALVPREYLSVDEKKIGAVVRALGSETPPIAGVRVFARSSIASRSR